MRIAKATILMRMREGRNACVIGNQRLGLIQGFPVVAGAIVLLPSYIIPPAIPDDNYLRPSHLSGHYLAITERATVIPYIAIYYASRTSKRTRDCNPIVSVDLYT